MKILIKRVGWESLNDDLSVNQALYMIVIY